MPGIQTRQPGDLHINTPLDAVSVAYIQSQSAFIADQVFPNIPVAKQSDLFWVWPKGTYFRTDVEARSPGAEPPRVSWKPLKSSYLCELYELGQDIFDEERSNADSVFQLDAEATMQLTQQHLLFRELKWRDTFFKSGVWARERAGVASGPTGTQFLRWDVSGSDPVQLIQTESIRMVEATGIRPNTLVITPYIEQVLINHALILDRIKYTGIAHGMNITIPSAGSRTFRSMLAEMFGIPRILVAETVVNTANETQDDVVTIGSPGMGFMFGKNALLCYAAPNPGRKQPTAGYTFSWTGHVGNSNMGMRTIKSRSDLRRADTIVMEQSFTHQLIAADLGCWLSAVIS